MRNGHYPMPPIRPELQAAYDEMDAKEGYFAYAVCRTYDGKFWEVNIRRGGMSFVLDKTHLERDAAIAAGEAWLLEQRGMALSVDEADYKKQWEQAVSGLSWIKELGNKMVEGSKRMQTDPEYRRYIQSMTH